MGVACVPDVRAASAPFMTDLLRQIVEDGLGPSVDRNSGPQAGEESADL
jgi:hypothetical protein